MFKIIFVSLIFFIFAQGDDVLLTPKEQMILKTVMRVDGYIDEELYNEFWRELRPRAKKSNLDEIRQFILNGARDTQLILWRCVKKSVVEKKVCKSKEYTAILNKMQNNGQMIAYNNTINLMESAVTGKPFEVNVSALDWMCLFCGINAS
jgi:hypothetical protein